MEMEFTIHLPCTHFKPAEDEDEDCGAEGSDVEGSDGAAAASSSRGRLEGLESLDIIIEKERRTYFT